MKFIRLKASVMYEVPKVFEVTARMRSTISTALCQAEAVISLIRESV